MAGFFVPVARRIATTIASSTMLIGWKEIPVHIVQHYDRMCHLYQAEALVRALRAVGNNEVNYFITMAGHSSLQRETDSKLCPIMNDLPD
jgi:predicted esterase